MSHKTHNHHQNTGKGIVSPWSMLTTAFAMAVLLATAPLQAAPIVRVTPSDDTYVVLADGDGSVGSNIEMLTRTSSDRTCYVKFQLSDFQKKYFQDSATFDVTLTDTNGGGDHYDLYGLNDGDSLESWSETTLGDTTPGVIDYGNLASNLGRVTLISSLVEPNPNGFKPETSYVSNSNLFNFINADTNGQVTFLMFPTGGAQAKYATKEHATITKPGLSLTLPEPASAILLGLSVTGLLVRRRR
ncbi:MAG: PEP-CTERM sorting domain-containing protein [Candidatus Pacebacteria bacterium]|nr:PEP-CTERM sorting domain-containing protein [Candidatus Paceibacterota bacterium]